MAKQAKTFTENVHHIIEETANDKGGGMVLCVSSWTVDGRQGKPQISKREKFLTEDGNWRKGAAKGLSAFDLLTILRHLPTIASHLKIPMDDIQLALNEEMEVPKAGKAAPVPTGQPF